MKKTEESIGTSTYVINKALKNAMCPKLYEEIYFIQYPNIQEYFRIHRAIGRELSNEIT